MFNYKILPTKLHAQEMFGSRELELFFMVAPKSICGPPHLTDTN